MNVTGHTRRPASIRDVATAAGVSYQTVSRVINGHPSVKPSTRERVLAAIDELGFRRNATALALASGRSRAVTVLTANTTHYGYASILQGIEEAARAAAYSVGIGVLESAEEPAVAAEVQRAADTGGGLIVIAYDPAGVRALGAVPAELPVVGVVETPASPPGPCHHTPACPAAPCTHSRRAGRKPEYIQYEGLRPAHREHAPDAAGPALRADDGSVAAGPSGDRPWVWTDDREAAYEATRHLLSLGHETVHYVAIPSSTRRTSARTTGWRQALKEAGAPEPRPVQGSWGPAGGHAAGRRLAEDPAVTAILCGNDDLALGVLRALHEAGRSVPGEVSVAGFDDAPHSAYLTPSLTTVRLDFTGLGRAAFALLHGVLEESAQIAPHPVSVPELVVRESAGPPPARPTRP
ncbi:LacI family DNA-binding transcriptional regulator [Streptomyces spongiae]|nr:LacI family DNA-binding transcriptional regulator [Streptomyces spongiae]